MDAAGARTTLHTFHQSVSFRRTPTASPMSNLFEGADGSLYGTTFNDFEQCHSAGTDLQNQPRRRSSRQLSSAYWLRAGVIQARDGRLYGTESGGISSPRFATFGQVFRVDAEWHAHCSPSCSTASMARTLSQSSSRLTTVVCTAPPVSSRSGSPPPPLRHGTIFRLDPATGSFATRYRFNGPDGSRPVGRLIQGTDRLIYGTTVGGWRSTDSARSSRSTPRAHSRPCITLPVPMARTRRRCDSGTRRPSLRDDHERRRVRLWHGVRHGRHRRADDAA